MDRTNVRIHDNNSIEGTDGSGKNVACWVSDLRPPGGRHDNDFEIYRDIQLVPTREEILCDTNPFLPLASGENSFIEDKQMRMLDANFRLLRQDYVSTMKSNLTERKRVWRNARIIDVTSSLSGESKQGTAPLSFTVEFDLSSTTKKSINWERFRALPHGGIVAFCKDDEVVKMATITIRCHNIEGKWLNAPRPTLGVTFSEEDDFISSLQEISDNLIIMGRMKAIEDQISSLKPNNVTRRNELLVQCQEISEQLSSYDLIEASSSYFSYESTLLALKQFMSIPLAEQLVELVPSKDRPEYLPTTMMLPNGMFENLECNLDNWSNETLSKETSLDLSQCDALHHALMSRVALIMGPPGTGKTFIGSIIAQMIRENTDETILCVCYTNHALDQFLENLYDAGERRLVRMGGMSKSEKLKPYSVRELARSKIKLSAEASKRMGSTISQLRSCNESISSLLNTLKEPLEWEKPEGGVQCHLKSFYPEIYEYFVMFQSENDSEFQIVGKTIRL